MYCFFALSFFKYLGQKRTMKLECVKYGETMDSDQATCQHPGDYCQHRTSCMIQFIEREHKEKTRQDEREGVKKD